MTGNRRFEVNVFTPDGAIDYRESMSEAQLIWRLGRWIGQRHPGVARLRHSNGEIVLRVRGGRIVGIEGVDASVFGNDTPPDTDLLATAHSHAAARGIPETEAVGIAKKLVQSELRSWFADVNRQLEIIDEVPPACEGHSISLTHAVVELLLSDPDGALVAWVLPESNVLLRRADGFLELYVPLGLSEEADLIVAKITGQRTASEIISRSPQPETEVARLLAALTATGMLEAVPVPDSDSEPDFKSELESPFQDDDVEQKRRLSPAWILAAALVLAIAATSIWWWFLREPAGVPPATEQAGRWGIVIDLGCEPHEYRRLLQVAQRHKNVQAVEVSEAGGEVEGCWRLVWGSFPTPEDAKQAITTIPEPLIRDGFDPHLVEVPRSSTGVDDWRVTR